MFFILVRCFLLIILAKFALENKEEKGLEFPLKTLPNINDQIEISTHAKIIVFRGFFIYYININGIQIIVLLNTDQTMTIKLNCIDCIVNPNINGNCPPGSANNYTFSINRKFILFKCNGRIVGKKVVVRSRKLCENYPLPKFTDYLAFLWIINHKKHTNRNGHVVEPSDVSPNVTIYSLSLNNYTLLNYSESTSNSNDVDETRTQYTVQIDGNLSEFKTEKNETSKGNKNIDWSNLIRIIPMSIGLFFLLILVLFRVRQLASTPAIHPIEENLNLNDCETLETETHKPIDMCQNTNVNSDITSDRINDLHNNNFTDPCETQNLMETGFFEQNYSSQTNSNILEKGPEN